MVSTSFFTLELWLDLEPQEVCCMDGLGVYLFCGFCLCVNVVTFKMYSLYYFLVPTHKINVPLYITAFAGSLMSVYGC